MTYTGGCHCGKIRFSVDADLSNVIECNCSYCAKKGLLLAFTPSTAFTLTAGDDSAQTEYRFNTMKIRHLFCTTCGVQAYGRALSPDGVDTVAINMRCVDGVDPASLPRIPFDGRSK